MRRWLGWALALVAAGAVAWVASSVSASLSAVGGLLGDGSGAAAPTPARELVVAAALPPEPVDAGPPPGTPGVVTAEQQAQLLPPAQEGSWEATPIGARPRALGRAGMDVEEAMMERQDALSRCFNKRGQAAFAGKPVTEVAQPGTEDTGSTVVVLQVEARPGELVIADAPVEVRSGATDATLACVQDKLRGLAVPSDAKPPAPRFRVRFTISP